MYVGKMAMALGYESCALVCGGKTILIFTTCSNIERNISNLPDCIQTTLFVVILGKLWNQT